MQISNFQLQQNTTSPYLDVILAADGQFHDQIVQPCALAQDPVGINLIEDVGPPLVRAKVEFELFGCDRAKTQYATMGEVEVLEAATGKVRYKWHPDDTANLGLYYGSFLITWADGSQLRWPFVREGFSIEVI